MNTQYKKRKPTHVGWDSNTPHGHTGQPAGDDHRAKAQIAGCVPLGRQLLLRDFVRGEVGCAPGTVPGEGGKRSAEDAAHAAFLVQLGHDVQDAGVLLPSGALALHLEEHFRALDRGGDERGGNGGEEARGGYLCRREGWRIPVGCGCIDEVLP